MAGVNQQFRQFVALITCITNEDALPARISGIQKASLSTSVGIFCS
jgi:hypothetical protein